jgi:adenylate cyclase
MARFAEQKSDIRMWSIAKSAAARGGISLTITLAASISALVLIAVIAVLGLGLWSGSQNTMGLLRDKAHTMIATTVERVRMHLDASSNQLEFIEQLIAKGRISPTDRSQFIATMTGALAAAPQIRALTFIDMNYQAISVFHSPEGPKVAMRDDSSVIALKRIMQKVLAGKQATWGNPLWREAPQVTILNLRKAVHRNGAPLGMLVASVTVRELSSYLGNLESEAPSNLFVLYGRSNVLAHPNLASGAVGRSEAKPLPTLAETGDPVLAAIWQRHDRYPLRIANEGTDFRGHVLDIFGDRFAYIYRNVTGYGAKDWQIGTYFRTSEFNVELQRLKWAALAGLATLALALLTAIGMARWIARPIVELAGAASRIGKLEISETKELPGSIFRELNDQARSFNTMLQGLRWFEIYVPKKLVRRLISGSDARLPDSVEREVTVIFSDIVGFTSLSEGASALKLAEFLNHHFALVAACIEEEDGTVDKFIGDSVMAFWGAPDEQPDHAERAVRAAQSITSAIQAENKRRQRSDEPPVRIRLGLHSGRVTVGNIGAPGRINYTIIGDTVNIGQRLEQLGKQFMDESTQSDAVTVLASKATVAQVASQSAFKSLGKHQLRGRDQPIEVFQLI